MAPARNTPPRPGVYDNSVKIEFSERGVALWRLAFKDHCELCDAVQRRHGNADESGHGPLASRAPKVENIVGELGERTLSGVVAIFQFGGLRGAGSFAAVALGTRGVTTRELCRERERERAVASYMYTRGAAVE